ncbi:MAG: fimbrillin family protein [Rikenellaceae bacterium]
MRNLLLLALCGIFAFVSCQDTTGLEPQDDASSVSFISKINDHLTKVSTLGFEDGDQISVYAYNSGGVTQQSNVKYSYTNEKFVSEDPIEYTGAELTYLAIYPYSSSMMTSFTVSSDQSEDYYENDILTAKTANTADSEVELDFEHRLSKIEVNVVGAGVDVSDATVSISAKVNMTCDFYNNTYSATGEKLSITPASDGESSFRAVVVPQFVSSGSDLITITIAGESYDWVLNSDVDLESGYKYVCNVRVSDGAVEFTGDIEPWTDGGDIPGGGQYDEDSDGFVQLILEEIGDTYCVVSVDSKDYTGTYFLGSYRTSYLNASYGGDVDAMAAAMVGKISEMYGLRTGESVFTGDLEMFNLSEGTRFWTYTTNAEYIIFVVGITSGGIVTTDVVSTRFTTGTLQPSDNQLALTVQDVGENSATAYVTTTNSDTYLAGCYKSSALAGYTDDEIMSVHIASYNGWANWATVTGDMQINLESLSSATDYTVFVYGCEASQPTTSLVKVEFTTGGEPAAPDVEIPDVIIVSTEEFGTVEATNVQSTTFDVTITPIDKEMSYIPLLCTKELYDSYNGEAAVIMSDLQFFKGYAEWYGITLREILEIAYTQGDVVAKEYDDLEAGTEYVYYAYGLDTETLQPITKLELVQFTTAAALSAPMSNVSAYKTSGYESYDITFKRTISGGNTRFTSLPLK